MSQVIPPRVRFAPSPTGQLHIGGARTVLFNWLHARKHHGQFILRIEDTDQERSTLESENDIIEALRWLGLDWDEGPRVGGPYGPYRQTDRLEIYRKEAERLVREGRAYRCYTTKEELEALRSQLPPEKRERFVYPHIWRDRTPEDWRNGEPYVIRFKTPLSGNTVFQDLVFGEISTPNSQMQDFILLRSDGIPLYNFGAVVDDITMKITLVARGRDHIINTPAQVLLYEALSYPIPQLAHLPMMLGPTGRKMGKRDSEKYGLPLSVTQYREAGYSPLGLLNYLVRFGWGHGDQEQFTLNELVDLFCFEDVKSADGVFDIKKCQAINQKIMREERYTPTDTYLEHLRTFLAARGLPVHDEANLRRAVALVRPRAKSYVDCAEGLDYFLRDEPLVDPAVEAKFLTKAAAGFLREVACALGSVEPFEKFGLELALNKRLTSLGLSLSEAATPIRVALSGRTATPGLFDVMEVLGKEATLRRLTTGATRADHSLS